MTPSLTVVLAEHECATDSNATTMVHMAEDGPTTRGAHCRWLCQCALLADSVELQPHATPSAMGQLLAKPKPACRTELPPASGSPTLLRLPDVLFPLVMQLLDVHSTLHFARAHRRLLKVAAIPIAWKHSMLTRHKTDRFPSHSSVLAPFIPVRFASPPNPRASDHFQWMTNSDLQALLGFSESVNLQGLDLSHRCCKHVPVAQLQPLVDHPRFRSLRELALGFPTNPQAGRVVLSRALLLSLSRMPFLRSLYLSGGVSDSTE